MSPSRSSSSSGMKVELASNSSRAAGQQQQQWHKFSTNQQQQDEAVNWQQQLIYQQQQRYSEVLQRCHAREISDDKMASTTIACFLSCHRTCFRAPTHGPRMARFTTQTEDQPDMHVSLHMGVLCSK
jgi:hypothetical protein